jgi:hypothetical protein
MLALHQQVWQMSMAGSFAIKLILPCARRVPFSGVLLQIVFANPAEPI